MERTFDVKGLASAWNAHSVDRIASYYAKETEILALPNPDAYRGLEGVKRNVRETIEGIPDVNGDVAWSLQQGNRAAALLHVTGTHKGPLVLGPDQTIPATGNRIAFELGIFWELDMEGKIVKETQIADAATLLMQVGVLGPEAVPASQKSSTKSPMSPR